MAATTFREYIIDILVSIVRHIPNISLEELQTRFFDVMGGPNDFKALELGDLEELLAEVPGLYITENGYFMADV
ncbi:hypothetical protein ABEB36_000370 [Hypothenemus hampei]|uniref:Uncharacterized protein n=1 Tax=Hypothenemus hampei TaxID=57062 RepID=A0ABD1FE71_HYPHA